MTKTLLLTAAIAALPTAASAAVINIDLNSSGRFADSGGSNDSFGDGDDIASVGFAAGNALVGNNGSGQEFFGIYAFEVTADFAADVNGGGTVQFDLPAGTANANDPGPLDLLVVSVEDGDLGDDAADIRDLVATNAGVSFATEDYGAGENPTAESYDVTAALTAVIGMDPLVAGDYIYLGVDPTFISGGQANNVFLGGVSGGSGLSAALSLTSTPIPEPTSALAAAAGLGTLLLRRRTA
jgi:hypothetical protein